MKETRATLETIAPTIEEAIAQGLAELGLTEDAVEIEVLDSGSKGLFGLGSRQARIRMVVKSQTKDIVQPTETIPMTTPQPADQTTAKDVEALVPSEDNTLNIAEATVSELLAKMKVRAQVTAHYGETDAERNRTPIMVDIHGDDLSILIGRRAETLNALQYIASLIVSKELGHMASLVIDVEGYRSRRENQLRNLARRMAEQAIKTGRRQILEPMPAGERRIVHMELREHPEVQTESVGEEPHRKVTIIPKEG